MTLEIELAGLEVFGHHGATEQEQREGQRFLFDLWLEPLSPPSGDRIDDAVDYRAVVEVVREISDANRFDLLETLATTVAEALLERFPLAVARVRVRKPEVRLAVPADYSAVTVVRASRR